MRKTPLLPAALLLALAAPALHAASSINPNRGTTPVVYDTGKGTHLPIMTCGSVAPDGTVTSTGCGDASASGQSAGNASLASIDSKTPVLVSGRQPVDGSGVTQPVAVTPSAAAANGIAPVRCQNCSSLVAKASAGNLYWLQAVSAVSQGYVMVVDAAAAPSSPSAVSPLYCMSLSVGGSISDPAGDIPAAASAGLVVLFSSTGCATYTALNATQLGAKAK